VLAFERAAELYRSCVELCSQDSPDLLELWQKLALALAHCGRGRQAAAAYLEAAKHADGMRRVQLERSAASHLLRCGAFEAGEALLHKVLSELKIETPTSTAGLIAAIGWERARLALRSLDFEPRSVAEIPPEQYFVGHLCGTLSIELQPYDPLRAALFQARSLRMALDGHVPELLARAASLAEAYPSPLLYGNICSARAVCR